MIDRRDFLKLSSLSTLSCLGITSLSFAEENKKNESKEVIGRGKELRRYLNLNSLARKILGIDDMPPGAIAHYTVEYSNFTLDECFVLSRKNRKFYTETARDYVVKPYTGNEFYAPSFEFSVINKIKNRFGIDYSEEQILRNIKKDFLKKEETIFIDFVKEVAKKNNRYLVVNSLSEAVKEIEKINYKHLYSPKKYSENKLVKNLKNRNRVRSSNLQGFILNNSDSWEDTGVLTIRQEVCILKDYKDDQFVTFEDIAMSLFGKNLTYIEVV